MTVVQLLVVGFHHKKGCQVEYCYPRLEEGLPPAWRYLPALALPDGSHNFHSDTIFFHLPDPDRPNKTLFAVSCFRQIPIEQVSQRTSDMTRSSVQKSVCIISREPFYGRLAIKLELVTRAWFRRGDFENTQILKEAYEHLNSCPILPEQVLEGLSVVNLIENWRHKAVLLFKLLLLQRKVILYGSPAGPVSNTLLTLLSLIPDCINNGLFRSANIELSRPMSPLNNIDISIEKSDENVETINKDDVEKAIILNDESSSEELNIIDRKQSDILDRKDIFDGEFSDESFPTAEREKCHSVGEKYRSVKTLSESHSTPSMVRDMSINGLLHLTGNADFVECGFPLNLFSNGHLCLPYLSLQFMDILSDPAVEGFVIGASNVLFKQKRQLFDLLIETGDLRIETADLVLRRQLQLTTEDLRFADHLVRHGTLQGDEWIREQFAGYLLCLLKTSLLPDGNKESENFNLLYMTAFKSTKAYIEWISSENRGLDDPFTNISPGHPFSGQLSVADMKLKFTHTMTNTDSGRKVTQAVVNTGKAVASTSRVVGGALSQAKGALSVWWSTLTTPATQGEVLPQQDADFEVLDSTNECEKSNIDISVSHDSDAEEMVEDVSVQTSTVNELVENGNSH